MTDRQGPPSDGRASLAFPATQRVPSALLLHLGRAARGLGRHRTLARYRAALPLLLRQVSPGEVVPAPDRLEVQQVQLTEAGGAIATLGYRGEGSCLVVKLARGLEARACLDRETAILDALRVDGRLGEWRSLLPEECTRGEWSGLQFIMEHTLPGRPALPLFVNDATRNQLLAVAARSIRTLHERTAASVTVDTPTLDRWVSTPIDRIRRLAIQLPWAVPSAARLPDLEQELRTSLQGRVLTVSWVHGDFWPGNLLVSDEGSTVTGLVDWDMGAADDLPQIDRLHLVIYTRRLAQHDELGDIVRELLGGAPWTTVEQDVLDEGGSQPDELDRRTLLLVYWLRHVAANLVQSRSYAYNLLWLRRNVEGVLRCC